MQHSRAPGNVYRLPPTPAPSPLWTALDVLVANAVDMNDCNCVQI